MYDSTRALIEVNKRVREVHLRYHNQPNALKHPSRPLTEQHEAIYDDIEAEMPNMVEEAFADAKSELVWDALDAVEALSKEIAPEALEEVAAQYEKDRKAAAAHRLGHGLAGCGVEGEPDARIGRALGERRAHTQRVGAALAMAKVPPTVTRHRCTNALFADPPGQTLPQPWQLVSKEPGPGGGNVRSDGAKLAVESGQCAAPAAIAANRSCAPPSPELAAATGDGRCGANQRQCFESTGQHAPTSRDGRFAVDAS